MAELLVNIETLTLLVKQPAGSLDEDAYTQFWAEAADDLVKTTANRLDWVGPPVPPDNLQPGEVLAPLRARNIATLVAKRAWLDLDNLQRRTSGPISDTFFESDLSSLELTEAEQSWLEAQDESGKSSGLWVQPIGSKRSAQPVYLEDSWAGGDMILTDDGSYQIPYEEV